MLTLVRDLLHIFISRGCLSIGRRAGYESNVSLDKAEKYMSVRLRFLQRTGRKNIDIKLYE